MKTERRIFRNGSTTFFFSTLFFPKKIRHDVFDLYGFLRVADDFVDRVPADSEGFYHFRSRWEQSVKDPEFDHERSADDADDTRVIKNMIRISRKHSFDPEWIEAFLNSMQSDLSHKKISTVDEMLAYMYGSAEVVGLMMAKILRLPPESHESARMQGRAMQMINFIRDIDEDIGLGRQYLSQEDLDLFGLDDLSQNTARDNPEQFNKFIRFELGRYSSWQSEAAAGYRYIPKRLLIPLKTAADMYDWTSAQISKDPSVVFDRKVKPSRLRVICKSLTNTL